MSVWLTIPSARPPEEANTVLQKWRYMGYKIALFIDADKEQEAKEKVCDYLGIGCYPGYAQAVNGLVRNVMAYDPNAEWFIAGGDDTLPDPNHVADKIAEQCERHFSPEVLPHWKKHTMPGTTFGVMQPTGDRFAGGSIDRIAGSPWLGREWCERINQGNGPLWSECTHMFVDEICQRVAQKLGVFWQRPDLIHLHRHFMRESDAIDSRAVKKEIPPHLVEWNSPAHWDEMKAIFKRLEAEDFASCMPIEAVTA